MKNANRFDVLKHISTETKEMIFVPLANISNIKATVTGGAITINVDAKTAHQLMSGQQFNGGLVMVPREVYETTLKTLNNQ